MASTPIPMMNTAGAWGAGNFNGAGTFSTSTGFQAPGTGGPGTMNYGNAVNPNAVFGPGTTGSSPTAAPQATQTSPGSTTSGNFVQPYQDQGGMDTSSVNNPYGMTEGQQYWQLKYLQDAFGPMGPMIYQYLNSNGGYNSQVTQQAVDATTNSMGKQIQLGSNSVASTLASQGITGGSSSMGDALTAYQNQATQQENAITAQDYYQMWQQSQENELNMMQFAAEGTGKVQANKPNWMDYADLGIGLAGDVGSIMTGIGMLRL